MKTKVEFSPLHIFSRHLPEPRLAWRRPSTRRRGRAAPSEAAFHRSVRAQHPRVEALHGGPQDHQAEALVCRSYARQGTPSLLSAYLASAFENYRQPGWLLSIYRGRYVLQLIAAIGSSTEAKVFMLEFIGGESISVVFYCEVTMLCQYLVALNNDCVVRKKQLIEPTGVAKERLGHPWGMYSQVSFLTE